MKILLHNRDQKLWLGGDAIQVSNTLKALKKAGVDAHFTSDTFADPRGYDLVHIFHINFIWTTPMIESCIKYGVPYVVSPIYFNQEYDNSFSYMSKLLSSAKAVLPLSRSERDEMRNQLNLPEELFTIVPNGVDKSVFYPQNVKKGDFALWVGRISDQTKGAHFAIQACAELGKKIVCVGASSDSEYSNTMKENCVHIERINDPKEMAELYNAASIYLCTSLSERQNLSVLEASACGTAVVDSIYNRGSDLLPNTVVNPTSIEELKTAITNGWGKQNRAITPSWDDVAQKLIKVYGLT